MNMVFLELAMLKHATNQINNFCFLLFISVTDSLFAARNYNPPPVSAPYLPVTSLNLVAKNFQGTAAAATQISQVS